MGNRGFQAFSFRGEPRSNQESGAAVSWIVCKPHHNLVMPTKV